MKAKIERVAVGLSKDATLTITTSDKPAARDLWDEFRDCEVEITVKKYRNKRSVNCNAFCWAQIGQIAFVLGMSKEEVYREIVRSCGLYETFTINNEAVDKFTTGWQHNGVGWQVEVLGKNRVNPYMTDVITYYGTSVYDSAEFSRIVNAVIEECKNLGISCESEAVKALLSDG